MTVYVGQGEVRTCICIRFEGVRNALLTAARKAASSSKSTFCFTPCGSMHKIEFYSKGTIISGTGIIQGISNERQARLSRFD